MKIFKSIMLQGKHFDFLSDNSQECDENCLFVRTTMNTPYHHQIKYSISEDELAQYFKLPPKIIGITGTNGKTTTASLIAHILLQNGYKVALLGTRGFFINNSLKKAKGLTTPTILELYSLLEQAKDCDFFVMEVSSHAIVQNRIKGLKFSAKILSNITSDHLDFHHTLEEYIRVKNSFFDQSSLQIINADDSNILEKITPKITYSIQKQADFSASFTQISPFIQAQIHHSQQSAELILKMCGLHNLYNALSAIACVKSLSPISLEAITQSLANFNGVEGRMEILCASPLIIVDFAHTHDGMEKILSSFQGQKNVILFGAGGDRDKSKRPKMGEIAEKYGNKIYLTSDNPRSEKPQSILQEIAQGIKDKSKIVSINPNRLESIQQAIINLKKDENLFVLGKGDETYQIIGETKIPFDDREVIRSVLKSQTHQNYNKASK